MSWELDHPVFDADNHYYEALDAFTRHLDPALGPRVIQWSEIERPALPRDRWAGQPCGDQPDLRPGGPPRGDVRLLPGKPGPPEPAGVPLAARTDPSCLPSPCGPTGHPRRQGMAGCLLFPTLGMIYEEPLAHDPEAVCHLFRAFNRWMVEDWTFNYQNRIYRRSLPHAGRSRPGPPRNWSGPWSRGRGPWSCARPRRPRPRGGRNPFDPMFDAFWGLANEAGVAVVVHAADSGGSSNGYAVDGFAATFGGSWKPSIKTFAIEQAIRDYLLTLIFEKHLERFPNLRIASVENGAEYLPDVIKKIRSTASRCPATGRTTRSRRFRRQVWINPFWEDDVYQVADCMGPDRVIFGSDWPHIEGLPEPIEYVAELKDFTAEDRRKILFGNVQELITLRPS